jgi:hypothetical protein
MDNVCLPPQWLLFHQFSFLPLRLLAKQHYDHPRWFPLGDRRISSSTLTTVENTRTQKKFSWQRHHQRQTSAPDMWMNASMRSHADHLLSVF